MCGVFTEKIQGDNQKTHNLDVKNVRPNGITIIFEKPLRVQNLGKLRDATG